MAKFVVEVADEDAEDFVDYGAIVTTGHKLVRFDIIERVDDEYQTRVCHCDTDCCSD